MYSFHCPSALNHLSLFSPQEKFSYVPGHTRSFLDVSWHIMHIMSPSSKLYLALLSFLNYDTQTIYMMIEISLCNWLRRLQRHCCTISHWVTTTGDKHSLQMKQVHLPPYDRFCSTFISSLGHWIILPIITACTSLIFPIPFSPDAAVFYSNQNTECQKKKKKKTVQYWS